MDEAGKWFGSVMLIGLGGFLIILSISISPLDLYLVIIGGCVMIGFGSFILYLRYISVKSQSRVQKVKITRVVREVPKPEPKPVIEEVIEEEKPKRPEILCDTCQFYREYHHKQKCKFLSDNDRMDMINAGLECVEYKIKLSLLD